MSAGRQRWGDDEVRELLILRAEDEIDRHITGTTKDGPILEKLAKQLQDRGFARDKAQVTSKLKSLRIKFHQVNDHNGRSGGGGGGWLEWPYFDLCHSIWGTSNSANPLALLSNMEEPAPAATSPASSASTPCSSSADPGDAVDTDASSRNSEPAPHDQTGRQLPLSSMRLLVPPLRLMSAVMWEAAQQRNVEQYGKLAEFISLVTEMVPELLSFKQRAQLILGLRARLILEMLQSGPHDDQTILEHLDHVQVWTKNSKQGEGQGEEVQFSTLKFVEMVQTLLDDPSEKEHFFKEVFPVQYGARFDTALQILEWEFFSRLEEFLPVPSFSQITSSFYLGPLDSGKFEQFFSDPEDLKTLLQHHKRHKTLEKNQFSFKLDTILSTLASKETSEVGKDQDEHTIKNSSAVENQQEDEKPLVKCEEKGEGKKLHQNPLAEELTQERNDEDGEKGSNKAVGSNFQHQRDKQSLLTYSPGSPELDSGVTGGTSSKVDLTCPICPFVHKRLEKLQLHFRKEHTENGTVQDMAFSHPLEHQTSGSAKKAQKHTCPQCGKGFRRRCDMKRHHISVHSLLKMFHCNQCDKRFTSRHSLKIHLHLHTGEKPYVCSYCGRGFSLSSILKSHLRIHTGERPFACSLCDKKFNQRYPLTLHLRLHRGEKPYLCSDCGKGFHGSGALLIHSRLHTGERPYHCDTCGKNYITLQRLKVHQRCHTGERPYPCPHCKKCFASTVSLKRHVRIHTGEKPFKCPICHRRFTQKSNVTIHIRSHKQKYKDPCPQ